MLVLRNCKICKDDLIDDVERQFLAEQISGPEACVILGCTMGEFKRHIETHLKRDIALELSKNAGPLAKRIFDKTNELIDSCDRTLKMIKEVEQEWKDKKKPEWVNAAIKLEQTLSNNIERLSKITGELRESSTVRVENLNIQVNNMTQEMIENLCPMCQRTVAPKLVKLLTPSEDV